MMKNSIFLLLFILISISSCNQSNKNYKVEFNNTTIHVTMKSPRIGVVGINQVDFDGFTPEDIEKEIFDEIRDRDYLGDYEVYVTLQFKDEYGNYYNSPERVHVSTLNGEEVKKYSNYNYFQGSVHLGKSYPWVHNYN